jgi:hypothetical protein
VNSRAWKITTFSQLLNSGTEFPDIFPDTPGNPENPGKCPDIPACQGESNSTEIKVAQM